jgi:hypothetical protein
VTVEPRAPPSCAVGGALIRAWRPVYAPLRAVGGLRRSTHWADRALEPGWEPLYDGKWLRLELVRAELDRGDLVFALEVDPGLVQVLVDRVRRLGPSVSRESRRQRVW